MNIFKFSVGSEAKRVAVRCVFAIGVVCWANLFIESAIFIRFFFSCAVRLCSVKQGSGKTSFAYS